VSIDNKMFYFLPTNSNNALAHFLTSYQPCMSIVNMPRISLVFFKYIIVFSSAVHEVMAFSQAVTPSMLLSPSVANSKSNLAVCNTMNLSDDLDYVRSLENKLIHFSKIDDDDVRRNNFEAFVLDRLAEELEITNEAAKSTIEKLKLKSLDFVKTMDKSILKLGQLAQEQGWETCVTSGFQPVSTSCHDIWPYVDMLIQFKLLISNMERMSNKRKVATGCPGLGSCKDGQKN